MKKTILVSLAGLALFLAGCTQQAPTTNSNINQPAANLNQNVNQPAVNQNINQPVRDISTEPVTQTACKKSGGRWGLWNDIIPDAPAKCNMPTSDAGKICTDSTECESYCQAEDDAKIGSRATGKCYEWKITAVCMQEVRGGIVDAKWCN